MFVAKYSPPSRRSTRAISPSSSRSETPGASEASTARSSASITAAFRSNSERSTGPFTRRACCVTGPESRSLMPADRSARYAAVPARSTATRSPVTPNSRSAATVTCAHAPASATGSSKNSQACIGRTSGARRRDRCTEFGCSKRMGWPSCGTTAHRTNVLIAYTGIALAPVAYRMLGSLKRTQAATSCARIDPCNRASRSVRSNSSRSASGGSRIGLSYVVMLAHPDGGGGGVIRTREGWIRPLTAFEAVPFVRSGTPPWRV